MGENNSAEEVRFVWDWGLPVEHIAGLGYLYACVLGPPVAYGNKTAGVNRHTGKVTMWEKNAATVRGWQEEMRQQAEKAKPVSPINAPVEVWLSVIFARPACHYGTGKNRQVLKPTAPVYCGSKPDADKILRAALDCLSGIWIVDDSRVARVHALKRYANQGETPCTVVVLRELP